MKNILKKILKPIVEELIPKTELDYEFCEVCGVAVKKNRIHKVIFETPFSYNYINYFCNNCKPEYDVVNSCNIPIKYYKNKVEISEDGKIIK